MQKKNNKVFPKKWKKVKLKEACNFERGIEVGSKNYNSIGKGKRFLRVADLTGLRNEIIHTCTDFKTDKIVNNNEILLTLDGSVGVVKKGLKGVYSTGIRKVSFKDKKNNSDNFLYYLLQGDEIQKIIKKHSSGSTIKHAGKSIDFMNVIVPENINEQRKITEILSGVDEDINKTDEVIQKTEKLKKGLMQELLTKGIGHKKFKKTKLGEIPAEWKVVKGKEISNLITKGSSPKWQGFNYQNSGTLFITSENVRDGFLDISVRKFLPLEFHQKLKNSQLKKNDILINIVGASIGRSCIFNLDYNNANINQAVCLMRTKSNINPNFIIQYLQAPKIIDRLLDSQGGSARQNLSLTDVKNFLFIIPSIKEQKQIEEILSGVDDKIEIYKKIKKN